MTRKSSKANKEKRSKEAKEEEPENEKFRSLEELNNAFNLQRASGLRSLTDLTKDFQQQHPARETPQQQVRKTPQLPKQVDLTRSGTGVLKKIFEGRGFGFITPDHDHGAGDVFLHFSDICSGGARSLGIGSWVRYDFELDPSSGRLRAKNVSVLPNTPSTTVSETPSLEVIPHAYNRDMMLGVFKALAASNQHQRRPTFKLFTVPMPSRADEEDPHLDDERLIARLEARLDKETGADDFNMQTFGTTTVGWTFEEAVKANEKIERELRIAEDSTVCGTPAFSFSEAATAEVSEREEDSDASGDRSESKDDTWSWEHAHQKSKLLDDHRQSWEVEQKQLQRSAPCFQ